MATQKIWWGSSRKKVSRCKKLKAVNNGNPVRLIYTCASLMSTTKGKKESKKKEDKREDIGKSMRERK